MHLLPTHDEVVRVLRDTGALRDGHFVYSNGLHTNEYLQVPLAMRYYHHAKTLSVGLSRLVRANPEIRAMIPELSIVAPATGGLPVAHIRSMQQVVGESTARNDFNMTLLTIFASVALVLAAIGIYGLMAYSVQQRTQEIGVRMALGANPYQVLRMVVLQGMRLNFIGVILGVAASLGLTRLMESMLFGIKPWDPMTIIFVVLLLSLVTLLAAYLPARRASRVDPIVALRYE